MKLHLFDSHSSWFPQSMCGHIWYYGKAKSTLFWIIVAGIPRFPTQINISQ